MKEEVRDSKQSQRCLIALIKIPSEDIAGGYGFYKRRLKEIQGHGRKDASLIKIMTEAYTLTGFNPAEDGEQCCAHKKTRLEI